MKGIKRPCINKSISPRSQDPHQDWLLIDKMITKKACFYTNHQSHIVSTELLVGEEGVGLITEGEPREGLASDGISRRDAVLRGIGKAIDLAFKEIHPRETPAKQTKEIWQVNRLL